MAPSSLKKMSGGEGRQEGIYASLDLSKPDESPSQNDLGLTLSPGSQIQRADENPHEVATESSREVFQIQSLLATSLEDKECRLSNGKTPYIPTADGCSGQSILRRTMEMTQTLAWIENSKLLLVDKELDQVERKEKGFLHHELSQEVGTSRLRYGDKVRGWKHTSQGDQGQNRCQIEPLGSADTEDETAISTRAVPRCDDAGRLNEIRGLQSSPQGDAGPPPCTVPSQLSAASSLNSPPRSLTSFYPRCPKVTIFCNKNLVTENSVSSISEETENGRPFLCQGSVKTSHDRVYESIQAELRKTKMELQSKTRAESDAQQIINELRKTCNSLSDLTNAYSDLQQIHSNLLKEHHQVLNSYDDLARAHISCRRKSSKKLAQRIIATGPSSNDSAYASKSPTTAAQSIFAPSEGTDMVTQSSHFMSPLIDLPTTNLPASRPPFAAPSTNVEQGTFIVDQDALNTCQENFDYANMNGFDDEANEMFNMLWENEMIDWDGEKEAELGQ